MEYPLLHPWHCSPGIILSLILAVALNQPIRGVKTYRAFVFSPCHIL